MLPGEKCSQGFLRDISKSYKQHNLTNIFTVLDLSQSEREKSLLFGLKIIIKL